MASLLSTCEKRLDALRINKRSIAGVCRAGGVLVRRDAARGIIPSLLFSPVLQL